MVESCRGTGLGELNGEVLFEAGSKADKLSEVFDVVVLVVTTGSAVEVTGWVTSLSASVFVVPSGLNQRVCCLEGKTHYTQTHIQVVYTQSKKNVWLPQ